MFKNKNNDLIFSPSDLILYTESVFSSFMDRLLVDTNDKALASKVDVDSMADLLAKKGDVHEAQYLSLLINEFGESNVISIKESNQVNADIATSDAMAKGYSVIHGGFLKRDRFAGYTDFLIKKDGDSLLGDYYYEVWDAKLSTDAKPYFLVQLCCYTWMLEFYQGYSAPRMSVILGDLSRDEYKYFDFFYYFDELKNRFIEGQNNFNPAKVPDVSIISHYGKWSGYANELLVNSDSIALVSGVRKSQVIRLHEAGIFTLTDLVNTPRMSVAGIGSEMLASLKDQAKIQHNSKGLDIPLFLVIKKDPTKGLARLPELSLNDVFFDIEGCPLIEGGLEYLWGVSIKTNDAPIGAAYPYKDWWGNTPQQERYAFESFIDWLYARWTDDNTLHCFHYASYEIAAIKKLSVRYDTRIIEVATLLSNNVFCDLYKIIKEGILLGESNYSIKSIEHLYRKKRQTEVANGGDSVVFYENWRTLQLDQWNRSPFGYSLWKSNPDAFNWDKWPALKEIRIYNMDDTDSTLLLAEWLDEQKRIENIQSYIEPGQDAEEKTDRQLANKEKRTELKDRQDSLLEEFNANPSLNNDDVAETLINLVHFYKRENKPKAWAYFDRLEKTSDELYEDDSAISNLTLEKSKKRAGVISHIYSFDPSQPIRKDKFSVAAIKDQGVPVKSIEFDSDTKGLLTLSFDDLNSGVDLSDISLLGEEPVINTAKLEARLCEVAESYFVTRTLPPLLQTIVNKYPPRFLVNECLPINRSIYSDNQSYLDAIIHTIGQLDSSCLCVQGPPGSGKTYLSRKVISVLIAQGYRVGIMSNSHAAIMNLLQPVCEDSPGASILKVGGLGSSQKAFKEQCPDLVGTNLTYRPLMSFTKKSPYSSFSVVGATAYGFAHDLAFDDPVDFLFVDEASQTSFSSLIAISGCAKNIILLGDQQQLEQPLKGSHVGTSGYSSLEYLLNGALTVSDDKGVFLERTYRMHDEVCNPLSQIIYEGRLHADELNSNQFISINKPQKGELNLSGIHAINISHTANTHSSQEEADYISNIINDLINYGNFHDKEGRVKNIELKDILIVSPYNLQVNLLKETLPEGARIGTIDKFQGQEAAIVIISMSISEINSESSRGMDFIFNKNRLNVAISRAKASALIVANHSGLKSSYVGSIGQMEKANFYCRLTQ